LTPLHRGVTTRPHRKPDGGERQVTYFLGGWATPMFPKRWGLGGVGWECPIGVRLASHPDAALSTPRRKDANITVTRWEAAGGGGGSEG